MTASTESILLIGDRDHRVAGALAQAAPSAEVRAVDDYFEALAELGTQRFDLILAPAEPIERRPQAAIQSLRTLAGDGRIILFTHAAHEPMSRKMLSFGADDYVITPVTPGELQQILLAPPLHVTPPERAPIEPMPLPSGLFAGIPLAEIVLDALVQEPTAPAAAAVRQIAARIAPKLRLEYAKPGSNPPPAPDGTGYILHEVRSGEHDGGTLHLSLPMDEDPAPARHFLAHLAHLLGRLTLLQDRHARLQQLAITDELTGLHNRRYFHHFLKAIVEKARVMRFPVTLLLFDIDGFKAYNDQFGHAMGDQILQRIADMMKRCVRDHDLVARLGGDEFAVVFWEKEGPRVAREPKPGPPSRVPQTAGEIFERFRRLLASPEFADVGAKGQGLLTVSGAIAVYPFDAADAQSLYEAADRELVFRAKREGKNCLRLVSDEPPRD